MRTPWILGLALVAILGGVPLAAADDASLAREIAAEARAFAGEDDYGRAVACALAAIILDPSLKTELSLLIAHQLTWQERSAEAVPWYRLYLESHPDDREARLGLARALSWSGQIDEAAAIYAALLAEDPSDSEARLGLARMDAWRERHGAAAREYGEAASGAAGVEARLGRAGAENARGRHREAERIYRELLEEDPALEEARVGLARALHWMGEDAAAERELRATSGEDALALDGAIQRDRGTRATLFGSRWIDRDEQELRTFGLRGGGSLASAWRWSGEFAVGQADEPRTPEIDLLWGGIGGSWRASRAWSANLLLRVMNVGRNLADEELIDVGSAEFRTGAEVKESYLLWDGWVSWTPADWTRLDVGYARVPIETPRSLARGIRVDLGSLGADWRFADAWAVRAKTSYGSYTDGNARRAAEGELVYGPWPLAVTRWHASGGLSWFSFDEVTDHGYYSPDIYDALWGTIRVQSPLGAGFTLDADVRVASEREDATERFGVLAGGMELRWSTGRGPGASGFWRASTSRFDTSAGYERDGFGFTLFWAP